MNPEIVLLDEPAAGMNSEETEDIARFIIDLHEERKKTVILVDHDMNMVMDIAERVMVLNFGEKLAEGTPKEIVVDANVTVGATSTSNSAIQISSGLQGTISLSLIHI